MCRRYLFFIGTLCNGGAERVVSILAGKMAEKGLNIEILTYYERERSYEIHPNVKISSVETLTKTTNKIKNLFWLRKYFRENAKVVLSFLAPFNMMAIIAGMGSGIPVIVADRNDPNKVPSNRVIRIIRDFLYVFADKIVVQTEKNKKYFNCSIQKKCIVIYNPVDLGDYHAIALKTHSKRKIVTAGRLMPQKNQKMLINAFSAILKQKMEYELVIYGEGPNRQELECLVKERGLESKVSLPGNVTDLYEKIKDAELFVLSSDYEGMPNALIEAMCMGLPCISTKVSGAIDLIQNGKNGILTEIGSESELTGAMQMLLGNNDARLRLAKEAVKLGDELSTDKIVKQWTDVIEDVISKKCEE